ncbi:unnamed protein product [Alopecurus aequalis]
MATVVLFFLVVAAAAPLLLAAKSLDSYSMAKPSTKWINNYDFFNNSNLNIFTIEHQSHSSVPLYISVGFIGVSYSVSGADYLFAVNIDSYNETIYSGGPKIIWSANRAHPVSENATLELTTSGNLVLRDADGSHVWSSDTANRSVAGMKITEIGNLVLFDHMNATVWQSFDYPTDTMVTGQSLVQGMRLTTTSIATNMYVTVVPDGLAAYVQSTPPQLYFHLSTGKQGNDPTKVTLRNGSLNVMSMPNMNGTIALPIAKSTQYMRLDLDGNLRLYELSESSNQWSVVFDSMGSLGMDYCDYPTFCGEYGVCSAGQCSCPLESNPSSSYFKPVDERNPTLGCTPLNPVSCQEIQHHQLLTIPNISYFDYSHIVDATSVDVCKQACLKNCSCMAVLFRDKQCVWVTKVFSMMSIQNETLGSDFPAYLKVQLSPYSGNNKNKKNKVMIGGTLGGITTLVFVVIVFAFYLRRRIKYEEKDEEFDFDQFPGAPTRYSFEKLTGCTQGFSKKLGQGGFGSVFEGKLDEERVAVKRLEGARQGKKEFLAEVETIGNIEHINLVKMIGFCVEKSERLLVYEYMSRGSLDRWIYNFHNNAPLDWCTRCRIILDVAKGLCYLHEECRKKIVHLDIKPQNILLDDNFNAKVADFGLCKLIDRDQSKVVTMMRGTPGYMAPEWLTSRITEKVDVYSFGVVIMEILSGRKIIDNSQPEENVQLINLLREKAKNHQLIDLIDKHSDDMVSHQEEVIQMMKLAICCLQHDTIRRPSMSTVIKALEGAARIETFEADSIMFVQDHASTYSAPSQASILSGPR